MWHVFNYSPCVSGHAGAAIRAGAKGRADQEALRQAWPGGSPSLV